MKRVKVAAMVVVPFVFAEAIVWLVMSSRPGVAQQGEKPAWEAVALQLFNSLTPEQKQKALLPWGAQEREEIRFTPGGRRGIQLQELKPEQVQLVEKLIDLTCSEYGAKQVRAIMDQEREQVPGGKILGRKVYYVTFFGEPAEGKRWAWRLWEHHMTLLFTSDPNGKPKVGPLLLGGHEAWEPPVKWTQEEKLAVELFASLTEEQKKKAFAEGKNPPPDDFPGLPAAELNEEQSKKLIALLRERLRCYRPEMGLKVRDIVHQNGGLQKLTLAFAGQPTKTFSEGGRFAWRVRGVGFLCDYTSMHGHTHMTLRAEAVTAK